MRTLSGSLTTAQKSSSMTPLVKIVLTMDGEDTQTYTTTRIKILKHTEAIYRQSAEVLLNNTDQALQTLDLRGFKGIISWGATTSGGDEYSACAPLWVIGKQPYYWPGGAVAALSLAGIFNLLDIDRASEPYTPGTDNTDTIKTILTKIADATIPCWHNSDNYTQWEIVYDSEDALIDAFIPKDSFRVNVGDTRLEKMKELIGLTKCVMRPEDDGKIHIFVPTVSGGSYDYEYKWNVSSEHPFDRDQYRKYIVIPNYVIVQSRPGDDPFYEGSATDGSSSKIEARDYRYLNLTSDAQATAIAEAIIATAQLEAEGGQTHTPIMNIGAEIYDYVKITNSVVSDNQFGNLGTLERTYRSEGTAFDMKFAFGEIAKGGFAGTLPPQLKRSPEKQSLAELYDHIEKLWVMIDEIISTFEVLHGPEALSQTKANITVRKNSLQPAVGTRPQLNFIEGPGQYILAEDDPIDDEIDLTFSSLYATRYKQLLPEEAAFEAANPAALAAITGTNCYSVLDFDSSTEESAWWKHYLTPDYQGENVVVDIFWQSVGAGDAKFGVSVLGREDGETIFATFGAEETVVTTNAGSGKLNVSRITTFSPNWSAGDTVFLKLVRKAADGADTIDSNDVRVLQVVISYTGQFSQSFYPLANKVDITPGTPDGWQTVDVSSYVPIGATGIWVHIESTTAADSIGLRMKGSTDNRTRPLNSSSHTWAAVGLDSNRKCEIYVGNGVNVYLIGYMATGVVFLENAQEYTLGSTGTWLDIDISGIAANAIGVIVEVNCTTTTGIGLRVNGSTDDHTGNVRDHYWEILGVDGSQIFEAYTGSTANGKFYVVGYILSGCTFKTDLPKKTLAATGAWEEFSWTTDAPSARVLFIRYITENGRAYGMRTRGSFEEIYRDAPYTFGFGIVPCDTRQRLEFKAEVLPHDDFYLSGYAT